ncbi:MAG TPA: hypothetical protein VLB69_01655, partial [Rudaea sp.]|nr:hypothetical protein [Rudaea sp.]
MRLIEHLLAVGAATGSFLAVNAIAAIPDAERAVLEDFYVATGGDNWNTTTANLDRWLADGTDPCTWFGVGCDPLHEHVTGLALCCDNLSGSLPASLSDLKNLRYIAVDTNRLTGPIPSLAGLTNLESVFVENNQLSGQIPPLTGLTRLAYFAADHNQLTGPIPSSLTDLPNLQYFVVDYNRLNGTVPKPPPTLTQFSAALCPNLLDTTPSADPAIDA